MDAGSHDGQIEREKRMKRVSKLALAFALLGLALGRVDAAPAVYSAFVVTDGQLGSWPFTRAMVVVRLKGDTRNTMTTSQGGSTVYVNDVGSATVTISQGDKTVTAHLDPSQIFARLDAADGVVGFGSTISPFYPISMSCLYVPTGCDLASVVGEAGAVFPSSQISEAVADVLGDPADSAYYSAALNAETTDDLRGPAHLGGHVIACINFNFNMLFAGCPATLPPPITTDQGKLYFTGQDGTERGLFKVSVEPDDEDD